MNRSQRPVDRYSRRVRLLKIVLPAAALALLLAVFLFPRTFLTGRIGLDGVRFDPAQGLRLERPRFSGATEDGRPFTIAADWALPDAPDPAHVTLGPVTGEIALDEGRQLRLEAAGGYFRPKDERVALDGGVAITTSDGYRLTVEAAEVDLAAQTLNARGPVSGRGSLGAITSDSLRATRTAAGNYLWFEGRVRVIVIPDTDSSPVPTQSVP